MECTICMCSKDNEQFKKDENFCQHLSHICKVCTALLKKSQCPYCQQDWSEFLGHSIINIYEEIYTFIAIIEGDIPLLQFLMDKMKVDISRPMNFNSIASLLTATRHIDIAAQVWNDHPHRSTMKKTYLMCNNIRFSTEENNYIIVS